MVIEPPKPIPKLFSPSKVISQLDIKEGMHVADLGCGTGFLTFEAAKKVGQEGVVYAVDVQKTVLSGIQSTIRLYGTRNVKAVWADLEVVTSTKIRENSVDVAIVATLLYQTKKHEMIFKEAHRIMKDEAMLLVLDWRKTDVPVGPDVSIRISKEDARNKTEGVGFTYVKDINAGEYFYGMVFKK